MNGGDESALGRFLRTCREQPGMVNTYRCKKCGWSFTVVLAAPGTTPFSIGCRGCEGFADSTMYREAHDREKPVDAVALPFPLPEHAGEPWALRYKEQGGLFFHWLDGSRTQPRAFPNPTEPTA